jgi:hypothetical protein
MKHIVLVIFFIDTMIGYYFIEDMRLLDCLVSKCAEYRNLTIILVTWAMEA